eukprot:g8926.t1
MNRRLLSNVEVAEDGVELQNFRRYEEVTDKKLLELITGFGKKYDAKMIRNACKRFVSVVLFLSSLNIAVVSTALHGYDSSNFEIVSKDAKCNNNFIEKCNETLFCQQQFILQYPKENSNPNIYRFLEKNAVSFLNCAFAINAASISIISSIALKGKLCVLGDCTAPEYIIKKLIKLTDLEAIQYNQSNTSANDADDDDDIINNNTNQSSRTYEIYGFQLPMCLNEIKFRKAVERKRKKELKQDRLMSEIYSRMCKKNPVPAFSSNDMKILRDEYNEFIISYKRGSLYFNRVSVQCREKLNTSMDCPPLQHQNVLLGLRTIFIVFYILFYLLLFSTFQSNNDSGEQELWKLPGNFLRYVLSIFHDVHTLTASLYPVLVFYVTISISSIQSVMFFLLEKFRCGDVNKNYEYHLQVYSSMALKYAVLRYILGLKDEIGLKDGNINAYFWRFGIFAPFILLSSYMLIGYMCRIDKFYLWMKDRYSFDNVKDFKEKFPRLFYLVLLLGIGAFYGQLIVLMKLKYF